MKPPRARRKCLHCNDFFLPDYRAGDRQRFCLKPGCRQARKRALQQAWLAKPENQNYFRDAQHAKRVRDWQQAHPDYWKNTARSRRRTLQDGSAPPTPVPEALAPPSPGRTLQDLCAMQVPLLVGLISMFTGSTLPDDIATTTQRLVIKGHDILGLMPGMNLGKSLHEKTCPQSGAPPESPGAVQLDRSPVGAGRLFPAV